MGHGAHSRGIYIARGYIELREGWVLGKKGARQQAEEKQYIKAHG
jgi:hypothetical protein